MFNPGMGGQIIRYAADTDPQLGRQALAPQQPPQAQRAAQAGRPHQPVPRSDIHPPSQDNHIARIPEPALDCSSAGV